MSVGGDLEIALSKSAQTAAAFAAVVVRYAECCSRFDWVGAERVRIEAMEVLDGHFDVVASMFKRVESLRK